MRSRLLQSRTTKTQRHEGIAERAQSLVEVHRRTKEQKKKEQQFFFEAKLQENVKQKKGVKGNPHLTVCLKTTKQQKLDNIAYSDRAGSTGIKPESATARHTFISKWCPTNKEGAGNEDNPKCGKTTSTHNQMKCTDLYDDTTGLTTARRHEIGLRGQ